MYLNNWSSKEDMIKDFEDVYQLKDLTPEHIVKYDHVQVLLASYGYGSYSGDSFVLLRDKRDGLLYENHASHCSCFGLENQWGPELTDLDSLKKRVSEGQLGADEDNFFKNEIRQVIHELSK